MKVYKILLGVLIMISVVNLSFAQEEDTFISGFGSLSCDRWIEFREYEEGVNSPLSAWVQGFLSGMNVSQSVHIDETIDIPDISIILKLMDEGCGLDESEMVYNIALSVYLQLYVIHLRK